MSYPNALSALLSNEDEEPVSMLTEYQKALLKIQYHRRVAWTFFCFLCATGSILLGQYLAVNGPGWLQVAAVGSESGRTVNFPICAFVFGLIVSWIYAGIAPWMREMPR